MKIVYDLNVYCFNCNCLTHATDHIFGGRKKLLFGRHMLAF